MTDFQIATQKACLEAELAGFPHLARALRQVLTIELRGCEGATEGAKGSGLARNGRKEVFYGRCEPSADAFATVEPPLISPTLDR